MTELKLFDPDTGLRAFTPDGLADAWPLLTVKLAEHIRRSTADFLKAIHPDASGWLELRAFGNGIARTFIPLPLTDRSLLDVQTFARKAHAQGQNVYHAVANRIDPKVSKPGALANCSDLWALYIDIDLKCGVPLGQIWTALKSFALPPSYIVWSGGGLHVYWLLDGPIDLTTAQGAARAYQWLGDLAHRLYGDPAVAEPVRVLRLPDTLNFKGGYASPCVTILTVVPDRRYTVHEIVAVLGDASLPAASVVTSNPSPIVHGLDERTRIKLARAWLERQAPAVEGRGGDKHTYVVCAGTAIGHDLTEDEALEALRDWNARCEPPWSEPGLRGKIRNAISYATGQRGSKLVEFPTTETGDAEYFADRYADVVRYDHRRGRWLLANDAGLWEPDPIQRLHRLAVEVMRDRQRRALLLTDADQRKKFLNWAVSGESRRRITNTLVLAQSVPPLSDDGDNWDPDPMLLGVPNGVVDLRTGTLRLGRPEDRVTLRARVAYDPPATCPLWEKTVSGIFGGDIELVAFIQRALGYSLTGDCREECFFLCWGEGENGKGTIMNTFALEVMGDYADDLPFSALELHERAGIPNDIAKLVGKRFVTASESGETARLNEARVKALTGRDPLTARFLHKEFFTFVPVAKHWLATNQKPVVRDTSHGFWRRIHLIPFLVSFQNTKDMTLKDRLKTEAPGILAWAVRGCLAWQKAGLNPPAVVRAATAEYKSESEQLSRWIEATCDVREDGQLPAGRAFDNYRLWCESRKEKRDHTTVTFGKEMTKRYPPAPSAKKARNVFYLGIAFRSNGSDPF